MEDRIPPSRRATKEAFEIAEVALRNIELSEIPLTNIALKAARVARLLNHHDMRQIFEYEVSGYPSEPDGLKPEVYQLACEANRRISKENSEGEVEEGVYIASIGTIEKQVNSAETALAAAQDRDVSISSANPNQRVSAPIGNRGERGNIRLNLQRNTERLGSRRAFVYRYLVKTHNELKFSGVADDIFTRIRERVDLLISNVVPKEVERLAAVYENLQSENREDWSNAVHSCRRMLEALADSLFPPQDESREKPDGKKVKLGKQQYINRLITFVDDTSDSGRFKEIVGSQLEYLMARLKSVHKAANKGSHDDIVTREEADRYVVYTYLVVGDILTLADTTAEDDKPLK